MLRFIAVSLALLCCQVPAHAGPAEDALAAFEKFFPSFIQGNQEKVAALFAPDAQFYGTLSRDLVTTPDGVFQYFNTALSNPVPVKAVPLGATANALSDSIVLVSGSWQAERTIEGKLTTTGPFRTTAVMHKRGDRWLIVQFHNSPRPAPPPAR